MKTQPPITHAFNFGNLDDKMRPYLMAEFAANNAPNLVLRSDFIRDIMRSPGFAKVLHADLESAGVKFVDAHAPFGLLEDLILPFEDMRPSMIMRLKLALEITADFGIDSMTCHVGNTHKEFAAYSLDQLQDYLHRSLEELLPTAERLGITIAIENSWVATSTPERLLKAIHHFNSDNLGLCYDSGHANLMTKDLGAETSNAIRAWERFGGVLYDTEILEKMLPYTTTCHLHDNDGLGDYHRLPGQGTVDWPHVMGLLKTAPRLKCFQNEAAIVGSGASIAGMCQLFACLLAGVTCTQARCS